ncbi:MAG: DNRLRE domain-containing protein [Planctomycetota bacterium]|jgi:hypothetical protein
MRSIPSSGLVTAAAAVMVFPGPANAGSVILEPSRDTTLVQTANGGLANGAGSGLFVGRTNQTPGTSRRRALLAFDLDEIPAGATIVSVELSLSMTQGSSSSQPLGLHRLTTAWGEGTSDSDFACGAGGGGCGVPATPDDATWLHTFFPGSFWAVPGGDFLAAASATQPVGGVGQHTWGSTPEMVADVQGWHDDPSSNHGWLILGNEEISATAKKFGSRESTLPPRLVVEYELADPCAADTDGNGVVDVDDLVAVILDWGTDGSENNTDINGDGIVNVDDLVAVILAWGPC